MNPGRVNTDGANSAAEVLAELIDGYAGLDAEGRLEARLRHAAGVKLRVTAELVSSAAEPLPDAERETLLAAPWKLLAVPVWTCPVPLVLFDVFYRPFAAVERPRGNIRWLRPSRELPYLASLADVGVLTAVGIHAAVGVLVEIDR